MGRCFSPATLTSRWAASGYGYQERALCCPTLFPDPAATIFPMAQLAQVSATLTWEVKAEGLGTRFLRHVERTRLLLFLVDVSSPRPAGDLDVLTRELAAFSPQLPRKPCLIVASKLDLLPPDQRRQPFLDGGTQLGISAVTGEGLPELVHHLHDQLMKAATD